MIRKAFKYAAVEAQKYFSRRILLIYLIYPTYIIWAMGVLGRELE